MKMRKIHRFIAVFAVIFAIFIASTGVVLQTMDLQALLRHAPATDPTMQGIRAGIDGPPNFRVVRDSDYSARPLPADFNYDSALGTVIAAGRTALGDAPMSYVELRMVDGKPVGQVASRGRLYRFDATSGQRLGTASEIKLLPISTPSLRNSIKNVHRMQAFGGWAIAVDIVAGLLMCAMIFTGLALYLQLYRARHRMRRSALYWFAGDWWRTLHRGVSITAALFLTVIAVSGTTLAISSIGVVINQALQNGKRPGLTVDVSAPLASNELPRMLHTTLDAYHRARPGVAVRALRLRYFAGMPQGIILSADEDIRQLVFNAATGQPASLHEPGYPATGQTFGWQVDETAKQIHRGDYFGLSGRWMSLLSGLSLLYIAVSGTIMYLDLWKRRRKKGRRALFWS
jgi:uncharacterized iron-regulated membrane protein